MIITKILNGIGKAIFFQKWSFKISISSTSYLNRTQIKIPFHRLYSNVTIPKNSTIRFEIYDSDSASFDDFIGRFDLDFDENGVQNSEDQNISLSNGENEFQIIETGLKNKQGEIVIREKNDKPSKLRLQLKIHR